MTWSGRCDALDRGCILPSRRSLLLRESCGLAVRHLEAWGVLFLELTPMSQASQNSAHLRVP